MQNVPIKNINRDDVHATPFPSFILKQNSLIKQWNKLSEKYFEFTEDEIFEETNSKLFFSAVSASLMHAINTSTQLLQLHNIKLFSKTEDLIDVSLIVKPCRYENQNAHFIICIPKMHTRTIDEQNHFTSVVQDSLNTAFMTVTLDNEGFILNCNQSFLKASHWTPKRVIGKTFWQLFPTDEENYKTTLTIWKTISNGQIWQGDVEKITRDGEKYWTYLTAIPVISHNARENQFLLLEKDITKEKTMQLRLEKIAYVDTETGLMNIHRLEQVVTNMIEEERHFSFVYFSLDKFYTIKELQQHHNSDSLIVEFTKRIKMYFQDSTAARINESDFVVLTPLPEWFIQGFIPYLQQNPVYIGNVAAPITLSGGITRCPEDQTTFSQIMKASLTTIQTVRDAGGASILALSKSTHKALSRKSIVEKRLLLALDQKNLRVLYQPQLDLKTKRIIAAEAFVRWDDEEIGVVAPDELIPIAEETGLIHNIGAFMLEEACKQALLWKDMGMPMKVCINSSVREFRDKNMAKSILDTLERTNCPAELLQIEITEKFALEAEAETSIIKQMRELEKAGITFALDDFGTGYGSFRYMQLLPIHYLKIDQTFMNSLTQSEKTQRLINGMIQLGKSMNLKVVAEGVETKEQHELLKGYGCDMLQGYIISKPIMSHEVRDIYRKYN